MAEQVSFDFERAVDELLHSKEAIVRACREVQPARPIGNRTEIGEEIAVACKRAIRATDMSREQVLDRINEALGLSGDEAGERELSIHMFNNYLSKPVAYPMPAYLLMAIAIATGSLEPLQAIAEPACARVVSTEEVRLMNLGKIETLHSELLQLRREIKRK